MPRLVEQLCLCVLTMKDLVLNHCWASIRASVNKDRVLVCGTQSLIVLCHESVLTLNTACMEIPFEHKIVHTLRVVS